VAKRRSHSGLDPDPPLRYDASNRIEMGEDMPSGHGKRAVDRSGSNESGPLTSLPALAALALLLGCSSSDAPEDRLAALRERGVLTIGYANEAPYAYLDPATGEVSGEAPAIARRFAAEIGIGRVEGIIVEFGSLIPGLQARHFDVIGAGMYITPERCRQVLFSSPTYSIGESLLVLAGNPRDLHSFADVAHDPEARLGVVSGAVELGYATGSGVPRERIALFPDNASALAGLSAGRVDAVAVTSLTAEDLLRKLGDGSIVRAEPFADPEIDGRSVRGYGAFAFRPDDSALRDALDAFLAEFLGTPEHLALVGPFGFGTHTLPGDVTTAELCAGP
jgi:polar amino acid transport system substrate-binding protein